MQKVKFKELFSFEKKSKIKAGDGFKLGEGKYPFYTSSDTLSKTLNEFLFKDESLIFGTGGLASIHYCNEKFAVSTDCFVTQTKNDKETFAKFIYYYLSGNMHLLENGFKGAGLKHISKGYIEDLEIPLPDLKSQQKIAEILDTADQLHQYNKQLIEKYDALKKSLFLEMFGDLVNNAKGWDKKTLKEISIRFSDGPFGSNLKTEHYSETGIQVIRLQNIGINKFNDKENDKSFVNETHYNNVLKKYSCYPNDIVIATMGNPNIRACVIPNNITVAVNKADCVLLRVNSNIANQIYIANLLNLEAFLNLAISFIHGQTRSRISSGQLAKILVPIPPINLQNQFAERVQLMETQKQQAQEALAKSEDLFQSLLQRAFKGELV
jgi:type I restriction enzyme S subunit